MSSLAKLLFCLFVTTSIWSQQDVCAGYQDSPEAPHEGPSRFNLISVAFSQADSSVLVADPQGHRFGADPSGKGTLREIARAFYEDDDTAEMDTDWPASQRPTEITIHYVQTGSYLISVTARKDGVQRLKLRASTCGKRWKKEISVPQSRKGVVYKFTLIYDSHATAEPQLVKADHAHGGQSH